MSLNKIISENVRVQRTIKKLTQKTLADRVGINVCNLSAIENARVAMRITTLEKLANALEVPPSVLVLPNQIQLDPKEKHMYTFTKKRRSLDWGNWEPPKNPEATKEPVKPFLLPSGMGTL